MWPVAGNLTDTATLQSKLAALYSTLNKEGVNQINLSFSQLPNIPNLDNQTASQATTSDTLLPWAQSHMSSDPSMSPLKFLCTQAHTAGIKVDLSFGGESASENPADMTIPGDGKQTANTLSPTSTDILQSWNFITRY